MHILLPRDEHLGSYIAALERGWSADTERAADAAREELALIRADPAAFLASMDDREGTGPPVTLPDGSKVQRLPGFKRWLWDGEFCGSIGLRWRRGTTDLPPYCLGHIGYAVVPWKRGLGYATAALGLAPGSEGDRPSLRRAHDRSRQRRLATCHHGQRRCPGGALHEAAAVRQEAGLAVSNRARITAPIPRTRCVRASGAGRCGPTPCRHHSTNGSSNMHSSMQQSRAGQRPASASVALPDQAPGTPAHESVRGSRRAAAFPVQTKLTISSPGDPYEQEADRLAEDVIRMPEPRLQRAAGSRGACGECHLAVSSGQPGGLHASPAQPGAAGARPAPPVVDHVLRSTGQPLDPATRAFMEPRFGADFSRVRVHADAAAARSAREMNAHAYTVGRDVVFGAGRFAPDTHDGRRLLAHELTHVVQQSSAHGDASASAPTLVQRQPTRYYEQSETEVADDIMQAMQESNRIAGTNVDPAFEMLNPHPLPFQLGVLAILYDRSYFQALLCCLAPGTKASESLIVAIRFTQCQKDPTLLAYEEIIEAQTFLGRSVTLPTELKPLSECLARERAAHEKRREEERLQREREKEEQRRERERAEKEAPFAKVFEPGSEYCILKRGVMRWNLYTAESAEGSARKQRMQIKFLPDGAYRKQTVTFLQTMREEGGDTTKTVIDLGVNKSVFQPFYGVSWDRQVNRWVASNEGQDIGFRSQPNTADDPHAYMFDEPWFFPPPHGRSFESVAIALETGEALGALTWGVGAVPAGVEKPKCADKPSAGFNTAVEKFYTPKSPAPEKGEENYDAVFDGFAPGDASLTGDHKKQLDALAARVKEIISKGDPNAVKGHLVIGGFGDAMDTDPAKASDQRARAVADYLTSHGVPKDTLDVRPFGASWARYDVSTKKAQEGRNRRVQIRLFVP